MEKNNGHVQQKQFSYDVMFKRFIEHLSNENLISFINGIYGKSLDTTLPVTRLATESNDPTRLTSDIYLRVGDSMYNIELQSSDDGDMALRMFEYGFRGAKMHGDLSGANITLRFPEPIVIYLRTTKRTPKELTVNVEFPHIGQTVRYCAQTRHLSELTPDIMLKQNLIPLLPFYPMKFESTSVKQQGAVAELRRVSGSIVFLHNSGKLSENEANELLRVLSIICERTAEKLKNHELKEAAKTMSALETIFTYDIWEIQDQAKAEGWAKGKAEGKAEGIAEGKAEGIAEGKAEGEVNGREEMLRTAIKFGLSSEKLRMVAMQAGISEERYSQIVSEVTPSET